MADFVRHLARVPVAPVRHALLTAKLALGYLLLVFPCGRSPTPKIANLRAGFVTPVPRGYSSGVGCAGEDGWDGSSHDNVGGGCGSG